MKLTIKNTDKHLDYTISKGETYSMRMNANGEGISPMEALLGAVAACSSVDTEVILEKMKQKPRSLRVEASAKRVEDQVPKIFKEIHLKFILEGNNIKLPSAEKAISMAVKKYCSVGSSLRPEIPITYEIEIIPTKE
ncbi:MAG: OsmC family peroxiredoxin [Saprospirales bacterium]|nr:MAG: OsmC family peroxiredoxin [Saprospirales bacterium]